MKKVNVTNGRDECFVNIEKIEAKYNAKFVGMLCLRTRDGDWANSPAAVFYQPNPPLDYSNYLALIVQMGSIFITSGASAVADDIVGVVADDGEILYSQYRHDYRTSKDGSVFIDGGRDYIRSSMPSKIVTLRIIDGEFYQLP